jgi:FAD/FMN-containing dehydrogenase
MPSIASTGTGAFLPELNDDVIRILAELFRQASGESMAVWNDYHGAVTRVPAGDAAFPLRTPGFDLFVMAGWHTPAERDQAARWVRTLRDGLEPHARGVYVNNLEDEGPARIREAYGTSYDRLAAIKGRYDPENLFRMNQNVEPAHREA